MNTMCGPLCLLKRVSSFAIYYILCGLYYVYQASRFLLLYIIYALLSLLKHVAFCYCIIMCLSLCLVARASRVLVLYFMCSLLTTRGVGPFVHRMRSLLERLAFRYLQYMFLS